MSARPTLTLHLLPGTFAVCQLPPDTPAPDWITGDLVSVTRTSEELSVVCEEKGVPPALRKQGSFRRLKVSGPLDFATTGVIAALAGPLADAGISLFPLGTYDTDYLLIRQADLERTVAALRNAGHEIVERGAQSAERKDAHPRGSPG
jgi:hypothetical protein